jgi:hypothetical protein
MRGGVGILHDALGQAELGRQEDITPSELVEAAVSRFERANPTADRRSWRTTRSPTGHH